MTDCTRRGFLVKAAESLTGSKIAASVALGNPIGVLNALSGLPPIELENDFESKERFSFSLDNLYNEGNPVLNENGELYIPRKNEIAAFFRVHYAGVLTIDQIEQVSDTLSLGFSLLSDVVQNRIYCGLNQIEKNNHYVLSDPNLSATLYILKEINNWLNLFENPQSSSSILSVLRIIMSWSHADSTGTGGAFDPEGTETTIITSIPNGSASDNSFLNEEQTKITYEHNDGTVYPNPLLEDNQQLARNMLKPLSKLIPRTGGQNLVLAEGFEYGNGKTFPTETVMGTDLYPPSVTHEWGHSFLDGMNSIKKIETGYSWSLGMFREQVVSEVIKQIWDAIYNYIELFSDELSNLPILFSYFLQIPNSDDPKLVPYDLQYITSNEIVDIYNVCATHGIDLTFPRPPESRVSSQEILRVIAGAFRILRSIKEGGIDESTLTENQRKSLTNFLSSLASWCKHLGLGYGHRRPVSRGCYNFRSDSEGGILTENILVNPEICPSYTLKYFSDRLTNLRDSGMEKSSDAIFFNRWFLIQQIFFANYLSLQDIRDPNRFVRIYLELLEYAAQHDASSRNNYIFRILAEAESYDPNIVLPQKVLLAANIWTLFLADRETSRNHEENIYLGRELFGEYALPITIQMLDWHRDRDGAEAALDNIAKIISETCELGRNESLEAIQVALKCIVEVFERTMWETGDNARYLIMSTEPAFLATLTTEELKRGETQKELDKLSDVINWLEDMKRQLHEEERLHSSGRLTDLNIHNPHMLNTEF